MTKRTASRTRVDRAQETVDGLNKASGTTGTGKCETCLAKIKPGKHGEQKRFCSVNCRRLAWAVRALAEALAAGQAEGLRAEIRRLGSTGDTS